MLSFFQLVSCLPNFIILQIHMFQRVFFQASGKAPNHASEEFQDCVVRLVSLIIIMLIKEFWLGK